MYIYIVDINKDCVLRMHGYGWLWQSVIVTNQK